MTNSSGVIVDYLTDDHLEWLVKSRSENQASALDIYLLTSKYSDIISLNKAYGALISSFVAINFSLWRAVFLSDVSEDTEHVFRDAQTFLKNLIASNTVAFTQDRGAREWTFMYYMQNVQFRLEQISKYSPETLPKEAFLNTKGAEDKVWWAESQKSLDNAVKNFREMLEEKAPII